MARIEAPMVDALNAQIGRELEASQQYLAMSIYLDDQSLEHLASFFRAQSEEEREHAMKLIDYLAEVGKMAVVPALPQPQDSFDSPKEIAEVSLQKEKSVTDAIHELVDLARDSKDHATFRFLQWFVDEQVEEEDTFSRLVDIMETSRDMLQVESYIRHTMADGH